MALEHPREPYLAPADPAALTARVEARLAELSKTAAASPLGPTLDAALTRRGKRVRPVMALLACGDFGGAPEAALEFGCAVEMVHTASLILDDLPCMDDASLRRGAPTLHRSHGEDAAVLAAIALLNDAHGLIARDRTLPPALRLYLIDDLAEAVGAFGLVAGQFRDLRDPPGARTEQGLAELNHLKTGVLFAAAIVGGAQIAGASEPELHAARAFARETGFAFQLCDDLRDALSSEAAEGKDVRQDGAQVTFVNLWGEARVRAEMIAAIDRGEAALGLGDSALARYARDLFARF